VKSLIDKYLNNTISKSELEKLNTWLQSKKNKIKLKNYIRDLSDTNTALQNINLNKAYEIINIRINKTKKPIKKLYTNWLQYAAIALIILGLGYIYQQNYLKTTYQSIDKQEFITLQLDNGNIKIINEAGTSKIVSGKGSIVGSQSGNQIDYNDTSNIETLKYNTLTVPYGKRFNLKLSDGTNVHLNAGTSLKYPVKFIKGYNRQIFLTGEAYFDVTKDKEHPFIVNVDELNIRVLGTQFNISSYPEDSQTKTVLVEGSVSIYSKNETYDKENTSVLQPGYMAALDKINHIISIEKTDVASHLAWRKGKLILNEIAFKDILKKLERQYNVTFTNNHKILENRYFTARFDIEDINQVMKSFSRSASFTYEIKNNEIIINP